jgi:hypothetical protein
MTTRGRTARRSCLLAAIALTGVACDDEPDGDADADVDTDADADADLDPSDGLGRYPDRHGASANDGYYQSAFANEMWDAYVP